MKPDTDKIDDAVLALLHLTSFTEGKGDFACTRAWKGHDWEALDRLHQKGLIGDPKNKNKSIVLSKEGSQKAEALFQRLFCD
ncbi:MAG: DUF6429 family protein [Verrucomicrobiota bacterium]